MRAVGHDTYGEPEDVLHFARVPVPEICGDDVLVRVRAAGVALDRTCPLIDAPVAISDRRAGRVRGKVVVIRGRSADL